MVKIKKREHKPRKGSPETASFREFTISLARKGDAGGAVVGVGHLEQIVRYMLKRTYLGSGSNASRLVGNDVDKNGRLPFFEQCSLAYCLGLIGPNALHDCSTLCQIRNLFAHNPNTSSFDQEDIAKLCGQLKSPDSSTMPRFPGTGKNIKDPRRRFEVTIRVLAAGMVLESCHANRMGKPGVLR